MTARGGKVDRDRLKAIRGKYKIRVGDDEDGQILARDVLFCERVSLSSRHYLSDEAILAARAAIDDLCKFGEECLRAEHAKDKKEPELSPVDVNKAIEPVVTALTDLNDVVLSAAAAIEQHLGDQATPFLKTLTLLLPFQDSLAQKARTKLGRPPGMSRTELAAQCIVYFHAWTDSRLSQYDDTLLSNFTADVFNLLGIKGTIRHFLGRALKAYPELKFQISPPLVPDAFEASNAYSQQPE